MIRYIEIENFSSFYKKSILDFRVNNFAPKTKRYKDSIVENERINKLIAVLGPNGSGKSNVLRSIQFLKSFILDSFGEKPDKKINVKTFYLKDRALIEPIKIKCEFEILTRVYRYEVHIVTGDVTFESLDVSDFDPSLEKERVRSVSLFSRVFIKGGEYEIKSNPDFDLNEGIKEIIKNRNNASLISAALFSNHKQSIEIKNFWSNVSVKIKQMGESYTSYDHLFNTSEVYFKNEYYKNSMVDILSNIDIGLTDVEIQKIERGNQTDSKSESFFYAPYGVHSGFENKKYNIPFFLESSGTQQLYILISTILPVLENGGIAVIDELEADLHPGLLPKILDLFISSKSNPKGAQLVFTCHATPLLNYLDKYQIMLVEKNAQGVSDIWRLDEVDGVRNDDNFFAKYNSGAYGGIPNL